MFMHFQEMVLKFAKENHLKLIPVKLTKRVWQKKLFTATITQLLIYKEEVKLRDFQTDIGLHGFLIL